MTKLYLIRHGQAAFAQENYDQLSANGMVQAQVLGQYLQQILTQAPYVVSGDLQRQHKTASLAMAQCFPEVPLNICAEWNEFNHQDIFTQYQATLRSNLSHQSLQHTAKTDILKTFKSAIQRWTGEQYAADYQESWQGFQHRIQAALQSLIHDIQHTQPRYVVVFSSGGVIATLVGLLLGLSTAKIFELNWSIANASMTTLHLPATQTQYSAQPRLLTFNEHHYLTAAQMSRQQGMTTETVKLLTWV